ncbi:MAG: TlpA family protein disulfide reductase [Acidobacteriaceae bacterium]|nr:TlpA family protein disulfide reductase [Acidobacteriaceae bacterium]
MLLPVVLFLAALLPVDESGFQKLKSAHHGKVVLVNFWATWCKPCRAEMPDLVKLQQRLKPRGFDLVLISADDPEQDAAAGKFLQQNGATGQGYRKEAKQDEAFINSIDPKWSGALPASFLYDKNGRLVRSFIGESDLKSVEAAILKLL